MLPEECTVKHRAVFVALTLVLVALNARAAPDPHFDAEQGWGQAYKDQWGLHRVNLSTATPAGAEVVVAVIDTGLDFFHPDLTRERIWRNAKEPLNGLDDDGNGYVDDGYGWDFVHQDNIPWDDSGHGTHVAGVIAANSDNGLGISGINPAARIMVLKAMNFTGHGRSSHIAEAIGYAVDHGARVINISLGGLRRTEIEDHAIAYAVSRDVVVVIAAGNLQADILDVGIAGAPGAITVGASGLNDERLAFSNYGSQLDLLAPGLEILSLRARRTDFAWLSGVADYEPGSNYVGEMSAYYRATGTSFAAPFVAGAASLLLSQNPDLTAAQVRRMLLQSAKDLDIPGVDSVTGHGLLDIGSALAADPEFFIDAYISGVQSGAVKGEPAAAVLGTAQAGTFASAQIYIGQGPSPEKWRKVCDRLSRPVRDEILCLIPVKELAGAKQWIIRLVVDDESGRSSENRFALTMG